MSSHLQPVVGHARNLYGHGPLLPLLAPGGGSLSDPQQVGEVGAAPDPVGDTVLVTAVVGQSVIHHLLLLYKLLYRILCLDGLDVLLVAEEGQVLRHRAAPLPVLLCRQPALVCPLDLAQLAQIVARAGAGGGGAEQPLELRHHLVPVVLLAAGTQDTGTGSC